MLFGDSPESGWPEEKNLTPAKILTIGLVKKNTITNIYCNNLNNINVIIIIVVNNNYSC